MDGLRTLIAAILVLPAVAVAAHLPPVVGDLIMSARANVNVIDMHPDTFPVRFTCHEE
jgi:hypothetical protein